jgi:Phage minor capsid protein 2
VTTPGDVREDSAIVRGRQARAILDLAELAILAAMARALRQVAAGTLSSGLASQQVRLLTAARLGAASRALAPLAASLPDADRQRIAAAILRAQNAAWDAFTRALSLISPAPWTAFAGAVASQFTGAVRPVAPAAQAQDILGALADSGITGFTDAGGRNWDAGAYVGMAVRTATSRALLQQHTAQIAAAGHDVVLIAGPVGAATCRLCEPYAGHVMTLEQMSEATAEGLYHHNCRHFPVGWREGMDAAPYLMTTARAGDYAEQQRAQRQARAALTARRRTATRLGPRRLAG